MHSFRGQDTGPVARHAASLVVKPSTVGANRPGVVNVGGLYSKPNGLSTPFFRRPARRKLRQPDPQDAQIALQSQGLAAPSAAQRRRPLQRWAGYRQGRWNCQLASVTKPTARVPARPALTFAPPQLALRRQAVTGKARIVFHKERRENACAARPVEPVDGKTRPPCQGRVEPNRWLGQEASSADCRDHPRGFRMLCCLSLQNRCVSSFQVELGWHESFNRDGPSRAHWPLSNLCMEIRRIADIELRGLVLPYFLPTTPRLAE
jgi:hypothetical protein